MPRGFRFPEYPERRKWPAGGDSQMVLKALQRINTVGSPLSTGHAPAKKLKCRGKNLVRVESGGQYAGQYVAARGIGKWLRSH